jgi:hypothetical protein
MNRQDANNISNNVPQPDYEKAELDLLRAALKRTHTERFEMMMQLIKMNLMLKKAVITHQKEPGVNKA